MMQIDGHRHFFFGKASPENLFRQLSMDHMSKTVLFGYHGLQLLPVPHAQDEEILAFSRLHPERILPFFCDFDLYHPEACNYIRLRSSQGFRGMGEILLGHSPISRQSFPGRRLTDAACIAAFQTAGTCGLPVLLHADPPFAEDLLKAVSLCPQTRFIWAHAGYDFLSEYGGQPRSAAEVSAWLAQHPNLYFDISMWKISPLYFQTPAWQQLLEGHAARFVFGSDMSEDYLVERAWLPSYQQVLGGLSEVAQALIGGDALHMLLPDRSLPSFSHHS